MQYIDLSLGHNLLIQTQLSCGYNLLLQDNTGRRTNGSHK